MKSTSATGCSMCKKQEDCWNLTGVACCLQIIFANTKKSVIRLRLKRLGQALGEDPPISRVSVLFLNPSYPQLARSGASITTTKTSESVGLRVGLTLVPSWQSHKEHSITAQAAQPSQLRPTWQYEGAGGGGVALRLYKL